MSDEDQLKFMEFVKSFNWQSLAALLKDVGAARAEHLVTTVVEQEKHATALTICARSTIPTSNTLRPSDDESSMGGMLETCQLLVKHGADLNHRDRGGRTALHWAVGTSKTQLTALLLSLGADVGTTDNNGHTALHTAICSGNQPCVALLLQHDRQILDEGDAHGTPPLTLAVQQGHSEICRQLLEAGADVTAQEVQTLRTPLHYALYLKHLDIFALLLSFKPNLRVVDHRGTTVIHRCCAVQEADYLAHVLNSGCQGLQEIINMEDNEGATPVIIACQNDNVNNLQLLLDKGAKVDTRDMHGRTALHHCVENSDTGCAEYLLKTEPSLLSATDGEGLTPLHMAVIAGNVPLIRLLLKRGASLQCRDQEDHTVAHWATVCGHCTVLDVLLEYGADLNAADKHQAYPVHYAAQMTKKPTKDGSPDSRGTNGTDPTLLPDNTRLLKKLLANNVSPDVRDKDERSPLIWAASAGNAEACRVLVEAGADVNSSDKDGLSALHCAASRGHAECVRMLVSTCKAKVDPVDKNQCTPLFYATTLGHEQCVKVLLETGASPNHTDTRGRTTAHCAAVKGSRDAIEALKTQGVNLWQPTVKGDYPIHEAAQAGHVEVIDYLLQSKEDPNAVNIGNRDGRTCLHIAALTNNLWLAKFLLDHNADINAVMRNKGKNYTPYDAAVAKGNKEAADYLLSRGGHNASAVKAKERPTSAEKRRDKSQHSEKSKEQNAEKGKGENTDKRISENSKGENTDKKKQKSDNSKEEKPENKDQNKEQVAKESKKEKTSEEKQATSDKKDVQSKDDKKNNNKNKESRTKDGKDRKVGQKVVPAALVKESERPASGDSSKDKISPKDSSQPVEQSLPAKVNDHKESEKVSAKDVTEDTSSRRRDSQPVVAAVNGVDAPPTSEAPASQETQTEQVGESPRRKDSHKSPVKLLTHADQSKQSSDTKPSRQSPEEETEQTHAENCVSHNEPSKVSIAKLSTAIEEEKGSPRQQKSSTKEELSSDSPKDSSKDNNEVKNSNKGVKSPGKDGKEVSPKKLDSPRNQDQSDKEQSATTAKPRTTGASSINQPETQSKNTKIKPASTVPQKPTSKPRQQRQLQRQLQVNTRPRLRSTSRSSNSSSRSRSRSPSPARSRLNTMGSNSSKRKPRNDGDGLNLFSENENTDEEIDEAPDELLDRPDDQTISDEMQDSVKEQKRRPKSSRLIATIQDSVRRYEQERKSIRQLQQLRRAQIYSGHTRNLKMFHSLLQTYGARSGAPTWDQILQGQPRPGDWDQHRGRSTAKPSNRTDSKETVASSKDAKNKNKSDGNKYFDFEKGIPYSRRHGGASNDMGNKSREPNDNLKRTLSDNLHNSASPRKPVHFDFGDPAQYRQFQRQRTEDMHKLLIKAYRPAWPHDLVNNGKPYAGKTTSAECPNGLANAKSARASTTKVTARTSTAPQSTLTPVSGQSTPSGVSHAQYRAVQRSYTIMTPYGTRRIRPDSDHQSSWSSRQGPM